MSVGNGLTLPRSSTKTSLIVSSVLVAEVTSADIQPSSLSGNQTLVPLLYMFSAMVRRGAGEGSVVTSRQLQVLDALRSPPLSQSVSVTLLMSRDNSSHVPIPPSVQAVEYSQNVR